MPYQVKSGNRNVLDENFSTATEARRAKYQIILGAPSFKQASRSMDYKIVKVARKTKKKK